MWVGIIIILIILFFVMRAVSSSTEKESRASERVKQNQYFQSNDIEITSQYLFESQDHLKSVRFVVDEGHKQVFISKANSPMEAIPFSEIIGCEIIIDSEVAGGVGRAIVGGAIAGGVVAIVGATTAKKHISTYQVVINRETIRSPQLVIDLINKNTKTDDPDYKNAVRFATGINSSIKAILSKKNSSNSAPQNPQAEPPINGSVADELLKLKGLLDSGLLTQEEFDDQKQRVLSSNASVSKPSPAPVPRQENRNWTVVLKGCGESKVKAIKEVRLVTYLGLADAKQVVDNLPQVIASGCNKNECEEIKSRFEAIGCTVSIE